jgi:hypothetical protein
MRTTPRYPLPRQVVNRDGTRRYRCPVQSKFCCNSTTAGRTHGQDWSSTIKMGGLSAAATPWLRPPHPGLSKLRSVRQGVTRGFAPCCPERLRLSVAGPHHLTLSAGVNCFRTNSSSEAGGFFVLLPVLMIIQW